MLENGMTDERRFELQSPLTLGELRLGLNECLEEIDRLMADAILDETMWLNLKESHLATKRANRKARELLVSVCKKLFRDDPIYIDIQAFLDG